MVFKDRNCDFLNSHSLVLRRSPAFVVVVVGKYSHKGFSSLKKGARVFLFNREMCNPRQTSTSQLHILTFELLFLLRIARKEQRETPTIKG